ERRFWLTATPGCFILQIVPAADSRIILPNARDTGGPLLSFSLFLALAPSLLQEALTPREDLPVRRLPTLFRRFRAQLRVEALEDRTVPAVSAPLAAAARDPSALLVRFRGDAKQITLTPQDVDITGSTA